MVVHQSKECLDRMGEWCQTHHAASGKQLRIHLLFHASPQVTLESRYLSIQSTHMQVIPLIAQYAEYLN